MTVLLEQRLLRRRSGLLTEESAALAGGFTSLRRPLRRTGETRTTLREKDRPMDKPGYHILVRTSSRIAGEPNGTCARRDCAPLVQYFEVETADRGIDALVTNTGCLKACEKGPIVIVCPAHGEGVWYGGVQGEEAADAIMDAIEAGETAEDYAL
jgi:(2Fe-2S) ferredoxin